MAYYSKYDYNGEDTVSRVQRYLVNKGKFQMNQTIVLLDDEIERLKKRLQMIEKRGSKAEEEIDKNIIKLLKKKKALKQIIHEIRTNKTLMFQEIIDEYKSKRKRALKRHQRNVSFIDYYSKTQVSLSKTQDQTETQLLNESINDLNKKIEQMKNESSFQSNNEANELLNRYKIKAKTQKKRCEELQIEIEELKKQIKLDRKEHKKKLALIQDKRSQNDEESKNSFATFEESINTTSLNDESSHLNQSNNSPNFQLRQRVNAAIEARDQAKLRLTTMKSEYKGRMIELQNDLNTLTIQLQQVRSGNFQSDYNASYESEKNTIETLIQRIDSGTYELQQLREENLSLRRKLNECDYIVHGRTGRFQRYTEITQNSYIQEKEEYSKSYEN